MTTEQGLATCHFCGRVVDPNPLYTFRRVSGWERRRRGGGANQITLREEADEWAHPLCIDRAKRGIAPAQEALL